MVWETYPWKQDLSRRKRMILKYNTIERIQKSEDAVYIVLEKSIFYSAFIIRKLIESKGRMSDKADRYTIPTIKYQAKKQFDCFHTSIKEMTHDWDHPRKKRVCGKNLCNWLIHSFLFAIPINESGVFDGFCVSSDYDRNEVLYYVKMCDWIDYMSFIATDYVVASSARFDTKANDYVFTKKERGSLK